MRRALLGTVTATVASVVAIACVAPAAADAAATTPCAKQARAVTSAKKAVTKAQKAKASTPAARKQRAKRVKVAKGKHARAKKALSTCKAKVKPVPEPKPTPTPSPAPMPVPLPEPAPAPAPPVLSLAATTVSPLQGFTVTVAAPALPAGMQYRVALSITTSGEPTGTAACTKGVIWSNVPASGQKVLFGSRQWCVGAGTVSLHRAGNDAHPSVPGELVLSIPVVVNPA